MFDDWSVADCIGRERGHVGQTRSSAPDPWSGFASELKMEADEGVGRRPGPTHNQRGDLDLTILPQPSVALLRALH
jgi:hypothetical protein